VHNSGVRKGLKLRREFLEWEKEGNYLISKMLPYLDNISERKGLKLSDFSLSTDPVDDFPNMDPLAMNRILKSNAFTIGRAFPIYIRTRAEFYSQSKRNEDWRVYGASILGHDRIHAGENGGERTAYTYQEILIKALYNYFSDKTLYKEFLGRIQGKKYEHRNDLD
jgi:hypothetical protein